jgi:hypothetical protein
MTLVVSRSHVVVACPSFCLSFFLSFFDHHAITLYSSLVLLLFVFYFRTLVAILENFQQPDGSVALPAVLHPYMNGVTTLVPPPDCHK